jgi:putative NADH-flavin reductase
MRLFVLGATGRTGVELIDLALAAGHQVTAFVRTPAKIARADARLRVVKGDPHSARDVAAALVDHDAVISALGPKPSEAICHTTLLRDCTASTLDAMDATNVRRILVVSSALLFDLGGIVPAIGRWLIGSHLADCASMESALRESDFEWTIARPPRLVAERDETYRARTDALPDSPSLFRARASWRAVARFLLDAVGARAHVREVVGICR